MPRPASRIACAWWRAARTDLPFEDDGFDRAYSENVAMNIDDKRRFYAEALRVLRPDAVFAFSHYGAGPKGEPDYPLPWAAGPGTSFLCSPEETREQVLTAGFEIVIFRDKTEEVLPDCGRTAGGWRNTGCRRWGCRRSWASGLGNFRSTRPGVWTRAV